MDKRVTLQSVSRVSDGAGGWMETWADTATVWGHVAPLSGREATYAQSLAGEVSHKVTIRYRAGITPRQRVQYGDRVFEVSAVLDPDEKHEQLELYCTELLTV